MILEGSKLLSVLANRVCDNQQAEIKRLRVENRILWDTGRVSVVIEGRDGFGADSVLATATLDSGPAQTPPLSRDVDTVATSMDQLGPPPEFSQIRIFAGPSSSHLLGPARTPPKFSRFLFLSFLE